MSSSLPQPIAATEQAGNNEVTPASVSDPQVSNLPWVVWSSENSESTAWSVCRHRGDLLSKAHSCVATVHRDNAESARAYADYIVTACNQYPALLQQRNELLEALKEVERHCPCGARPESPRTHPHVIGCPVGTAIAQVEGQ